MNKNKLFTAIGLISASLLITKTVVFSYAFPSTINWVEPSSAPYGGIEPLAVINTGENQQIKAGFIGIGNATTTETNYWIAKTGNSLALKNNELSDKVVIGQDGNVGIDTAAPSEKLEINGKIKTSEVCINGACRSAWQTAPGQSCPASQALVGFNSNGGLICSGVRELDASTYPCSNKLPTGDKRIFVTSLKYDSALAMATATSSDVLCQDRANSQSLPGTYKALMYDTIGGVEVRSPYKVLPAPGKIWNGQKSNPADPNCVWHLVASNPNDFFTYDASNNYLVSPIKYDEGGIFNGQTYVWTNFLPTGFGNYNGYTSEGTTTCPTSGTYAGKWVFGDNTKTTSGWALNGTAWTCTSYPVESAALYCIEQ